MLLLSNPWGANHTSAKCSVPMNPFAFDYAAPCWTATPTYSYEVTFDPSKYRGFPHCYAIERATFAPVIDATEEWGGGDVHLQRAQRKAGREHIRYPSEQQLVGVHCLAFARRTEGPRVELERC